MSGESRPVAAALGLALIVLTSAAWGQTRHEAAGFRVSWEPRTTGLLSLIDGRVYNDSRLRVTNVLLRVEGVDADGRPVGESFPWALGAIVPGGETSFVVERVPGAVTYRITVHSYDIVSGPLQSP